MSSFIWISLFKTCRRDLQSMESVWPKTRSEWSGQCDGMTLHQGTQVRQGWTNHSRVLDPYWPMGGEHDIANTGMTGNRSWPGPLSGPPGLFYLRLNISNIFSSRLHIFWPTSHWIFSPTNLDPRPSSRLDAKKDIWMLSPHDCDDDVLM